MESIKTPLVDLNIYYYYLKKRGQKFTIGAPLIHEGIEPPVRKPIQSFVKELQLNSTRPICQIQFNLHKGFCIPSK